MLSTLDDGGCPLLKSLGDFCKKAVFIAVRMMFTSTCRVCFTRYRRMTVERYQWSEQPVKSTARVLHAMFVGLRVGNRSVRCVFCAHALVSASLGASVGQLALETVFLNIMRRLKLVKGCLGAREISVHSSTICGSAGLAACTRGAASSIRLTW